MDLILPQHTRLADNFSHFNFIGTMLYIAQRNISEYDGPHLILGVFRARETAQKWLTAYEHMILNKAFDYWKRQANPVSSADDLRIIEVQNEDIGQSSKEAFLLFRACYGFGQVIQFLVAASGSREGLWAEKEKANQNATDCSWKIERYELDRPYFNSAPKMHRDSLHNT